MLLDRLKINAPRVAFLGGRPSMGKTAFAASIIEECIAQKKRVFLFSLDGNKGKMHERISLSDENTSDLLIIKEDLKFSKDMENAIRGAMPNPDIVIVDYLQLFGVDSRIADLHAIAREFNCFVLVLSQLSREIEYRDDMHPVLADINSEPYDDAYFLYRDAYYDKDADRTKAELIIAKSSQLIDKKLELMFDPQKPRFTLK